MDNLAPEVSTQRRYDIDWLRNLGILMLFPFHSARIFDLWEPNYVKNAVLSPELSWFIAATSYWFMPLLFWLAGSASWYSLQKRSGARYLGERVRRLLIPCLFGILFIVPPQGYLARLGQPGYTQNYWQFLRGYFVDFHDLTGYFGSFTPGHLWFILYLFILALVALPLLLALKRSRDRNGTPPGVSVLCNSWTFILLFIPLTLTEALPAPGGKNPFYYLFLFVAGYYVCSDSCFQALFNRIRLKCMIFLLFFVPFWFGVMAANFSVAPWSSLSILLALMRNLALWLTLIVILGYGNKYLNTDHPWLPYLNEAAFPVYILHQTVMMGVGFYVIRLPWGIVPKFTAICITTFIISLALYEWVIKRFQVTRVLLGVKIKQPTISKALSYHQ